MRTGQHDQTAVAGEDIAQVKEKGEIGAADRTPLDEIVPDIRPFIGRPAGVQRVEPVPVVIVAQSAAGEAGPVVGQFHQNRPGGGMQGQLLQALVEGKAVLVAGDIPVLQIGAEAGRPCRCSGRPLPGPPANLGQ